MNHFLLELCTQSWPPLKTAERKTVDREGLVFTQPTAELDTYSHLPATALSQVNGMLLTCKPYWARHNRQILLHRATQLETLISQKAFNALPSASHIHPWLFASLVFLEGVSAHTEAIYSFYCLQSWHGISTWQVTAERFPDSLDFQKGKTWENSKMWFGIRPSKI